MRPARRTGRPTTPAVAPDPSQWQLIRRCQAHRPTLHLLASALGISNDMLRRELRGVRLMPVARQVALWYLLEGCK